MSGLTPKQERAPDNVQTMRALLIRALDVASNLYDGLEDEGDRTYLGSTNDADTLKKLVDDLTAYRWSLVERTKKGSAND